jgi:prepilin signal peptidase PulO-like enzyme (type II secretory pathway)
LQFSFFNLQFMDLLSDPIRWLVALWFAILGGAVGSFINVVVYRLPAGLGISWPPSHCPQCKHPIRAYDNVPVLAWLWLRGRCRDCGRPISARYPLVEALTAGLFVLLVVVEVFYEGHNLPLRTPPAAGQPAEYPVLQAMAICAFHLALLCTLLASALITLDGHRPPWRLFAPLLAVGCVAPMIWPWLHPQPSGPDIVGSPWAGVIDSLIGLGAGYCLGRAARWLGRRFAGIGRAGYQVWGEAMLLGVVLGWRAAVVLLLSGMFLEELTRLAALRWRWLARATAAVWLVPLTLLWILNWAAIARVVR